MRPVIVKKKQKQKQVNSLRNSFDDITADQSKIVEILSWSFSELGHRLEKHKPYTESSHAEILNKNEPIVPSNISPWAFTDCLNIIAEPYVL